MGLDGQPGASPVAVGPLAAQRSPRTRRGAHWSAALLYSEELGIDLAKRSDAEYFRWFLASLLFGARISETTAKNTYRSFIRHGLTNPQKILRGRLGFPRLSGDARGRLCPL